jgi:hypothetical protein
MEINDRIQRNKREKELRGIQDSINRSHSNNYSPSVIPHIAKIQKAEYLIRSGAFIALQLYTISQKH